MPVGRYLACVGATLLALLYLADWFLPKSPAEPTPDAVAKPVIRIASVQQPPERVIIDTSQPTITPPMVQATIASKPLALQSYASVPPPTAISDVDHKKQKPNRRKPPKFAPDRPQFASNPTPARHSPTTNAPPVRLSFGDLISRLRKNLFNLN